MQLPFSRSEFFAVFARYNESVWPAQLGLYALAIVAIILATRHARVPSRMIHVILAVLWLWMGIVYHGGFLAQLTSAAWLFALAFIAEAVLFIRLALKRRTIVFAIRNDSPGWMGGLLVVVALVLYPAMSFLAGHRFPAQPTFGLPCPTTIFTLGVLLWATRAVRHAFVIPVAWALIGTSAALNLGAREDFSLIFALAVVLAATASAHRSHLSPEAAAADLMSDVGRG